MYRKMYSVALWTSPKCAGNPGWSKRCALLKALVTIKPLLPEIELAWALRAAKFCIGPNDRRKA